MQRYLVSQPLVVQRSLQKEPAERAVVVVLMLQCLHQLQHVHLDGLVLHVRGTEGSLKVKKK